MVLWFDVCGSSGVILCVKHGTFAHFEDMRQIVVKVKVKR